MAKDLYKSRQMYQGPWIFYIIMVIGVVLLLFFVSLGYKYYNQYILDRDTKDVLYQILERDDLHTQEEYKNFAKKELEELGYDVKDATIILNDDSIILINYKSYFSVIGELITKKKKTAVARFKGYLNEYKEAVVEKYTNSNNKQKDEV